MASIDPKEAGKEGRTDTFVVRNVHITVEVKVTQRFLISKSVDETIDDMFVRLRDECRLPNGKKDCETCRLIVKWAEECDGEICDVISSYNSKAKSFIMDICVDFKTHEDSNKFCNGIHIKLQDS